MFKYFTLVLSLNLTETVNLSLKSDWLIGKLIQDQQRLWKIWFLVKSRSPPNDPPCSGHLARMLTESLQLAITILADLLQSESSEAREAST